jgi:hypothetical protein
MILPPPFYHRIFKKNRRKNGMTTITKTKSAPAVSEALKVATSHRNDHKNYSTFNAALQYAEQGFFVHPCKDKIPLTEHGKDDATTNPEQIKAWWSKWPKANVAINLELSGLFALDVDNLKSWERMQVDHGGMANEGPIQITPRGGRHFIWSWPYGMDIPAKVDAFADLGYPGIDLRSRSYIILSPSRIDGKPYTWQPGHGPESQICPPSAWLMKLIRNMRTGAAAPVDLPPDWTRYTPTDKTKWARSLLDRLAAFRCNNYTDWIQVGMSLSELREAGLTLWDSWSRSCPEKYKGFEDCAERWKYLKPGDGITLGSLYHWANQDTPDPGHVIVSYEPDAPDLSLIESPDGIKQEESAMTGPFVSYMPKLPRVARLTPEEETRALQAGRWVDDYVRFAVQASPMTPALFHQSFALGVLSTAIARRVYVNISKDTIYPNLYMLLIAPSTLYAKTTGLEVALDLLNMAGLEHLTLPHGVTPQSLITELSCRTPPTFSEWDQDGKDDWQKERVFAAQRAWWMDEAASILDLFKQKHTADLLSLILKLYNCPKKLAASTIGRGRETVRFAYLSICGPTTPAAMRTHLKTPELWADGLFARFLFVTPDTPPVRVFYPETVETPPGLAKHINTLAFQRLETSKDPTLGNIQAPPALRAGIPPEVRQKWDNYHEAIFALLTKKAVSEKLYACYGRFPTTVIKIAQLLAVSDWTQSAEGNPLIIRPAHWDRAQMITEGYRASLHRLVEDSSQPLEDEDQEIREKVVNRANTSRNSRREIAQDLHMAAGFQRDRLDKIISQLLTDGVIEEKKIKHARGPETGRLFTKNP